MAAWVAAGAGFAVDLWERKPSVGRKLLIAGRGGLNLTHGEAMPRFRARYGAGADWVGTWLDRFDAGALRRFAADFGIETFVGSSGRVFPRDMKAAPLLRHWVHGLRERGVTFHVRHELKGLARAPSGAIRMQLDHDGTAVETAADAVVLALGGASWPQLGSDGRFVSWLSAFAPIEPWQPDNCGVDIDWSPEFARRRAGAPFKSVRLAVASPDGSTGTFLQGECVASDYGLEGSLVYAHSRALRAALAAGPARFVFDLLPSVDGDRLKTLWVATGEKRTRAERLRRLPGLDALKIDLVFEAIKHFGLPPNALPGALKALPIPVRGLRPIAEAISSAGGVRAEGLDSGLMVKALPGVFCAGEMLDWDAPTGGYLLTASIASGVVAAESACRFLAAGASIPG